MPTVRPGPVSGLAFQGALLAVLAATAGLGAAGWIFGAGYGLFVAAALVWGMHRTATAALGPADWVTLTRATLVGGVTAMIADSFARDVRVALLVGTTIVALLLDGLDGHVARRTRTASELGARFDMEVDAFLILVLGVYVAHLLGWWVLAMGAMRYAFVAAGWLLPWMRSRLPPRFWRKVVAAVQGTVLVVASADLLPKPLMTAAVAGALALLVESFGRDVLWLYRHRSTVGVLDPVP